MRFGAPFEEPFYLGAGTDTLTRSVTPVSIGGVGYLVDTSEGTTFQHSSVPLLRGNIDDRETAGGATLNPDAWWWRTVESWHVGAGQTAADRKDSDGWRFHDSRGVDPWKRWQLSLLHATTMVREVTNANARVIAAGDYLYLTDGADMFLTQDTETWTEVSGMSATPATSIATDGHTIATTHGSDGVYVSERGTGTAAKQFTGEAQLIGYVKARWITCAGNVIYDVTTGMYDAPGDLPDPLYENPNTDFVFNAITEGPSAVYVGGYSGDRSIIYKLNLKDDGTGLHQPIVAGMLPDGETITGLGSYLGFVLLGTTKGVRVAIPGANGDLNIGAFIPADGPVEAFEGQDRFVWYTLPGDPAGLGRIDLQTFSDPESLAPAYAHDLDADVAGEVRSVVTFHDRRVFTVPAHGVYMESDELVESGYVDSGMFNFGLTDDKIAVFVDVSAIDNHGAYSVALSTDRGEFGHLATIHPGEKYSIGAGEARGREFEVRITLHRDPADPTQGTVLRDWTLRAQPAPHPAREIIVPLLLGPDLVDPKGAKFHQDPAGAFNHIINLWRTKRVVRYTQGGLSWPVIVHDYQLDIRDMWMGEDARMGFAGTCHVKMKVAT